MIFKKTLMAAACLTMLASNVASAQPGWVPPERQQPEPAEQDARARSPEQDLPAPPEVEEQDAAASERPRGSPLRPGAAERGALTFGRFCGLSVLRLLPERSGRLL